VNNEEWVHKFECSKVKKITQGFLYWFTLSQELHPVRCTTYAKISLKTTSLHRNTQPRYNLEP